MVYSSTLSLKAPKTMKRERTRKRNIFHLQRIKETDTSTEQTSLVYQNQGNQEWTQQARAHLLIPGWVGGSGYRPCWEKWPGPDAQVMEDRVDMRVEPLNGPGPVDLAW